MRPRLLAYLHRDRLRRTCIDSFLDGAQFRITCIESAFRSLQRAARISKLDVWLLADLK